MSYVIKAIPWEEIEDKNITFYGFNGAYNELKKTFTSIERGAHGFDSPLLMRTKTYNLYGPDRTGKTTMLLNIAKEYQYNVILINGPRVSTEKPAKQIKEILSKIEESEKVFVIVQRPDKVGFFDSNLHPITTFLMALCDEVEKNTQMNVHVFVTTYLMERSKMLSPHLKVKIGYVPLNDGEIRDALMRFIGGLGLEYEDNAFDLLTRACNDFTFYGIETYFQTALLDGTVHTHTTNTFTTVLQSLKHHTFICEEGQYCQVNNYSCYRIGWLPDPRQPLNTSQG